MYKRQLKDGDGSPWYVAAKELDRNALVVVQGKDHRRLLSRHLQAGDASWIDGMGPSSGEPGLAAKTRYRQADAPCSLGPRTARAFELDFDDAQWAVTPGQSAVLYRGEECLGGGVIARGR